MLQFTLILLSTQQRCVASRAVFLGTSPGDARIHITTNVLQQNDYSTKIIVQVMMDNVCSASYPCVMPAIGNVSAQCVAMLQKHANQK